MPRPPHLTGGSRKGRPNRSRKADHRLPPVVQQLLRLQDKAELTDRAFASAAGYAESLPPQWRSGSSPSIRTLTDFASVLGYEVCLVPKGDPDA